jgi:hypothetical protein
MGDEEPTQPVEIKDAYWQVPVSDYVPPGPAPGRTLVDEPRWRLELVWDASIETLRNADLDTTDETADDFATRVRARKAQLAAARAERASAERPAAAMTAVEPRPPTSGWFARAGRLLVPAALLRRLLAGVRP